MSLASTLDLPQTPDVARAAPAVPRRAGLLFAVVLGTAVTAFALAVVAFVKPFGDGDALPTYASVAPMRGYVWTFFVFAGVQLIVGACAAALAGWILARDRGARWATVGGSIVWLGAALYGVGIGGWAAVYYFATDSTTLGAATATRLVDHINDDAARMLAVPVGGALLIALGSLLIAVALWRARTVPRWVPVVGALSAVATILLPPSGAPGLVAEAASSLTTAAVGWYVWRPYAS